MTALSACSGGKGSSPAHVTEPAPPTVALSVSGSGAGSGRVISQPAGIDCAVTGAAPGSGTCNSRFPIGTVVLLQQEPVRGAVFEAWSSSCTGNPCVVTMNAQRTVDVTYRIAGDLPTPTPPPPANPPASVMLTVAPSPASRGTGTITSAPAGISCAVIDGATTGACSTTFALGTIVTLTQAASGTSIFQGWSGDCIGSPCQVTMAQARVGEVTYRVPPAGIVSISGTGTGTGSVTSSPSGIACTSTAGVTRGICSASFDAGSTVTLIAGGSNDGSFDGFTGACIGATCTLSMTSGITSSLSVGFTAAPQRLTVTPGAGSSGGGVVTSMPAGINCVLSGSTSSGNCNALFAAGSAVTLQQSSSSNSVFSGWAGDCTVEPCQLALSQGRTAQPVFRTQGIAVTGGGTGTGVVASSPSGISCSITVGVAAGSCSTTFPPNTVVTLTATPSGMSSFSGYTGACAGTTCTLTMVTGSTSSVTAQFTAPPTLALSAVTGSEGGGTLTSTPSGLSCALSNIAVSGTCTAAFALNTSVTVSQVASNGSVFVNWAGACSGAGNCVVSLSQSRAVQALYRLAVPGSVTVMAGSGTGAGSVSSSPGGVACSINGGVKTGICRAIFPVGSTVTLIATASGGATFTGFSGSCSGMTCVMTIPENGDIAVTANFTR